MGPLSRDEEVTLARRALAGDSAAEGRLVAKHTGLVKSLAKPMRGRGVSFDDLVQIGLLAMLVAIRRFDPDRGNRLSTYATPWVRRDLTNAVLDADRKRLHLVDSYDRVGQPVVDDPEPEDSLVLEDVEVAFEACLTEDEQTVLGMHYGGVRGMSYRDIGLMTGRSKHKVGRIKRRAVAKLRAHFQPAA